MTDYSLYSVVVYKVLVMCVHANWRTLICCHLTRFYVRKTILGTNCTPVDKSRRLMSPSLYRLILHFYAGSKWLSAVMTTRNSRQKYRRWWLKTLRMA